LLEDFGDDRVRDWLDERPGDEAAIYEAALAPLTLGKLPAGPFPPYDMAVYLREVGLLVEWYAPLLVWWWMRRVMLPHGNRFWRLWSNGRARVSPFCAITMPKTSCCWMAA
jgi:hypothetical protein